MGHNFSAWLGLFIRPNGLQPILTALNMTPANPNGLVDDDPLEYSNVIELVDGNEETILFGALKGWAHLSSSVKGVKLRSPIASFVRKDIQSDLINGLTLLSSDCDHQQLALLKKIPSLIWLIARYYLVNMIRDCDLLVYYYGTNYIDTTR